MSDKEVLCHKNDLCKHLNDHGYVDFGTYESNEQYQLDSSVFFKGFISSLPSQSLQNNTLELTTIDSYNHDMIMRLLKSKLLFLEDVKFVESVLKFCYVRNEKSMTYIIGAVATSFISIAALFNRCIDSYLPLSCVAMSSIYAAWKLYKDKSELKRSTLVTRYVNSLQNLCIDFHKVLRFLKEVEILSTGQVSTQNVGSAMYISVNSVNGLNELPPWKTLPNLRKAVAESLIDVINIFSCGCNYISKFSPSWMDIKGFNSNIQLSLDPLKEGLMFEDIKTYDGCISMKDLQMLNDNYLLAQSEFLKWLAFHLCPAIWKDSKDGLASFKNGALMKYLENTQTKIFDTSIKLKLSFDLQKVLACSEFKGSPTLKKPYPDNDKTPRADLKDLKELQVELHQIFVLVLSTVQKAKSLEDCLDTFSRKITEENDVIINDLKENLLHQLSIVKSDLAKIVKDYDHIYSQILGKNKSIDHEGRSEGTENTASPLQPHNEKPERIKVGHSDFAVNSPDEVFLAISGSKHEDFETNSDDWFTDKKPKIPKTLLTELSTTLKPIKKVFEERERLVLKKLGIQDTEILNIEDKEAENPVSNHNDHFHSLPGSTSQCFSRKNAHDENQSEATSEDIENMCVPSEPVQIDNNLLMANLLKIKLLAKQRSNLEEECFFND